MQCKVKGMVWMMHLMKVSLLFESKQQKLISRKRPTSYFLSIRQYRGRYRALLTNVALSGKACCQESSKHSKHSSHPETRFNSGLVESVIDRCLIKSNTFCCLDIIYDSSFDNCRLQVRIQHCSFVIRTANSRLNLSSIHKRGKT